MILDLLEGAGVEVKRSSSKEGELRICCPFCPERSNPADERYLLGINERTGLAYCFHCHWKSDGVRRTVRELCRVLGIPYGFWIDRKAKNVKKSHSKEQYPEVIGLPVGFERFSNIPDSIEKKARGYLKSRGVSLSQIVRHGIGYAAVGPMAWRILFPVLGRDGDVFGCVGRTFGGGKPKYLNTPGIKLLWGAEQIGDKVIVVEGVIDALRVERAMMARRNTVVLARLGSTITKLQLGQLRQYSDVVIFPDRDQAGAKGAMDLAFRCVEARLRVSVVVPKIMDDADPGSMSDEEILHELGDAKPWNEMIKNRLLESITKHAEHYPLLI